MRRTAGGESEAGGEHPDNKACCVRTFSLWVAYHQRLALVPHYYSGRVDVRLLVGRYFFFIFNVFFCTDRFGGILHIFHV